MKPREAGEGLSQRRIPASFPPPLFAFRSVCLSGSLLLSLSYSSESELVLKFGVIVDYNLSHPMEVTPSSSQMPDGNLLVST